MMRKQSLAIQFAGGVSTKMDAKQVPTTQLLNLENATFVRQSSLAKRNGYEALGQTVDDALATYEDARGLAERDGELVLFTETSSYSYRPASNTWSDVGDVASVTATTMPLARTGTVQVAPDAATLDGITVLAWEDSRNGVYCSVIEQATGRILLPQTALDTDPNAISPRCVVTGSVLMVLYARRDAGRLYAAVVNTATPSLAPTPVILADDLDATNPVYDAARSMYNSSDQPGFSVIAWAVAGGYRIGYLAVDGTLGAPANGFPSVLSVAVAFTGALAYSSDDGSAAAAVILCGVGGFMQVRFHDLNDSLAALRTVTSSVASTSAIRATGAFGKVDSFGSYGEFWYAVENPDVRSDLHAVTSGRFYVSDSTLDGLAGSVLLGHCLASKAWRDGAMTSIPSAGYAGLDGDVYVCVVHAVRFFPYVAAVRLSASTGFGAGRTTVVARLLPLESTGAIMRRIDNDPDAFEHVHHLPSVTAVGITPSFSDTGVENYSREHSIPLGYRIQLDSEDGDQFAEAGIKVASLNFDDAASYQTAQLGRGLYLAGACPSHYDGDRWVEGDYHTAPDYGVDEDGIPVDLADALSPGELPTVGIVAGTYLYKFWYEDVDGQGELHVGPVNSVLYELVLVESEYGVVMEIPTYRLTSKRRVRICVARSVSGQTGTDATIPCYRVTGIDPGIFNGPNCYVLNDPEVDSITFTDNLSDAELLKREPCYTNGGILSNDPEAWAGGVIAGGKGRLFWTDPTDPNLVRYSQERREETGLEAPARLSIPVDPYGGAIVGIGVMDDAIYPLKETAIYVFGGPGPDADGGFVSVNAFSPAQLVTSDVGCTSPTSIAQTPVGIVFQSSKGIMLLGRDRSIKSIGDPVYRYNDQRITRATLLPDRHQVVFLTDAGRTLLWDYERNQWSTYTNHQGYDASVVAGTYHYLRTDGRVFRETPGVYRDDNSHIPMVIETAWIKMAGYLQGWQKVIHAAFLGTYVSSHTFRVRHRLDYQEGYSPPIDVDVDSVYAPALYGDGLYGAGEYGGPGGLPTLYQAKVHINRRCMAISFRVEDVESTEAFGASFELSELTLTGGVIGPLFAPGATRQA